MLSSPLAQVKGIDVHRGPFKVLEGASVTLEEGEIVAVMGENGSGKTTLIEAFAGILPLRSGEVIWQEGDESTVVRDSEGRRNPPPPMGLTLQRGGICGDETVFERMAVSLSVAGISSDVEQILELLEHWGLRHRSNDRVAHLSGGLRRRLAILCGLAPAALSQSPRVVLLDEPSEGLDESAKVTLRGWIRALSSKNHGILMATHDKELSSCADRVLVIEDKSLREAPGDSSGEPSKLPGISQTSEQSPISSLVRWSMRMELRNPIETVGRATPAIVAILLSYALIMDHDFQGNDSRLLAALILAPAFIASISSPALVSRLSESDCGRWWNAVAGPMARPAFSITGSSILLPIPVTYLSWFVLSGSVDDQVSSEVILWLWIPALVMMDLAIAATALHLLVADLSRSSAAPAPLLLVVLVWPFLELTDALSSIIDEGVTWGLSIHEPLVTCIVASLISALVWLAAVMIPDY
jgi:ABC-type multidrug transport system ATPase subunit|tara:strand:- start:1062 stop:2471 length:1410 start_codon:yes stop_codon:yes gene_type:complete